MALNRGRAEPRIREKENENTKQIYNNYTNPSFNVIHLYTHMVPQTEMKASFYSFVVFFFVFCLLHPLP